MFTAVPLFLAGVGVALWILPKGLALLIGFTPESVSNLLPVDTYLSFLVRTMLVFGIGFLVPIFIVGLNLVGILSADAIRRSWRWTVIAVFIFGAVATPTGDPLSMMLLGRTDADPDPARVRHLLAQRPTPCPTVHRTRLRLAL